MAIIDSMTGVSMRCEWLFNSGNVLEFFPTHSNPEKRNRVASVYGKNGSGKSTVAQGFREYIASTTPRTVELLPLANGSHIHVSPSGRPEKFFVFDENYIEQQVKVKEQGLDAIVLFGEQVYLEQQIEQVTCAIDTLKPQKKQQEDECSKFTDSSAVIAPQYWSSQIAQSLRTSGGWAEIRGIKINGNRTSAVVNNTEIDRIGMLVPDQGELETKAEFNRHFTLFSNVTLQSQQIAQAIPLYSIARNVEETAIEQLAKIIVKPQTTARENELLQLFGIRIISDAKAFLADTTKYICPTCLQEVGDKHRIEMLSCIEGIFNREVEAFRAVLSSLKQKVVVKDDYSLYCGLNAVAYCNVQTCIDNLNQAIEKHNDAIQAKIDNPFKAMIYDASIGLIAACNALNQALTILEAERTAFNGAITGRTRLKSSLLKLNDEIAHYVTKDAYIHLVSQRKTKRVTDETLASLIEQIAKLEKQKLDLNAQRKNFQIAIDDINSSLAYIFFSTERLKLVLGADQMYHLKSNGKEVDPTKVSCGERNALALCYYFTEIAKETDIRAIYADEAFLVIDDPVSSFDMENRIGILSFLRWRLGQVLLGCPTTKVLLMTHDISVLYDLEKALQEISKECDRQDKSAEFCLFELGYTGIDSFKIKKRNEYTRLIETIYDYALNGTVETELFVGNAMRRVLEAFSTFFYRKGIADVSCDPVVLSEIDEDKRSYFQNLMYRLVLNGESHYEEHIQGLQGMEFFSHLSTAEKQHTARDILCFMYLLNKPHILAHLTPCAEPDILVWLTSI
ncbi:MAG: AAA family ATPase, partial [Christensenellaceae bacterium]